MSDYTYPDEFIRKAESRIRKQVTGNGLDPKTISLIVKRQGVGTFTAKTSYDIDVAVTQSSDKGKITKGKIVDQGQTKTEIDQFITDFKDGDAVNQIAKSHIKSLPLNGFGADKMQIPLKDKSLTITEINPCGRCQGQGQSQCQTCHGRGQSQCQLCYGQGLVNCLYCQGLGQIQDGQTMKMCNNCQGKMRVFCTQCHGQKEVPCPPCQAKGRVKCNDCNGDGVNSTHTTAEPYLKISSAINVQELDQEPKTFAAKITPEILAKGGHVDVKETKPPESKDDEKPSELSYYQDEDDPLKTDIDHAIYYAVAMPWAVAGVEVAGKPYNVAFVGKKGAVCDAGHFMDDVLDKSSSLIQDAAHGQGFVAGLLKEACQARVSRETLSLVIKTTRKKAMVELGKSYGIGMTKEFLKSLVQNAYLSLKRVTRRPRYIGLAIGLLFSAVIYYYWFMSGGRDVTSNHPQNMRLAMDGIPLGGGAILTLIMIKAVGFMTFRSVIRDIGLSTTKMPPVGKAGLYGFVGNLLLWGGFFGYLLIH